MFKKIAILTIFAFLLVSPLVPKVSGQIKETSGSLWTMYEDYLLQPLGEKLLSLVFVPTDYLVVPVQDNLAYNITHPPANNIYAMSGSTPQPEVLGESTTSNNTKNSQTVTPAKKSQINYITNNYPTTIIRQTIAGNSNSTDYSSFISKDFLYKQVDRIFNTTARNLKNLSDSLAQSIVTSILSVSGDATIGGNLTITGTCTGCGGGGGGDAFTTSPLSQFSSTTSGQLAGIISDETGTNKLVYSNSPTLVTPILGAAIYTTLVGGNITDSALTSGRVTFAGASGILVDDSDLTFATDTLSATKLLSPTSVSTPSLISTGALTITPAAGSNLNIALSTTGDFAVNTNQLYVDTSTSNVGIGTDTPDYKLDVAGNIGVGDGSSLGIIYSNANSGDRIEFSNTGADVNIVSAGTVFMSANGTGGVLDVNPNNENFDFRVRSNVGNYSIVVGGSSGYVGIGTNSLDEQLTVDGNIELKPSDYGVGAAGPILIVGRNNNGTTTGAGSVNFQSKAGTAGYVWQDNAGNLRVNSSAPTSALDTAGVVVGTQTSTRNTKQDITDYTDYAAALNMVTSAPLHTFRYIKDVAGYGTDSPLAKPHIGYIADEVPGDFMWGNSIDQVSVNGILMASIKQLNLNLESLASPIPEPNSFGDKFFSNLFSKTSSWLGDSQNGIMSLFAETIYSKKIHTDELCVGTVCVNQDQFLQMVNSSNASSSVQTPPPAPTIEPNPEDTTPPAGGASQAPETPSEPTM